MPTLGSLMGSNPSSCSKEAILGLKSIRDAEPSSRTVYLAPIRAPDDKAFHMPALPCGTTTEAMHVSSEVIYADKDGGQLVESIRPSVLRMPGRARGEDDKACAVSYGGRDDVANLLLTIDRTPDRSYDHTCCAVRA